MTYAPKSLISSGFPLSLSGEKVVAVGQEVARLNNTSTSPSGTKVVVLAEAWDTPGRLTSVWMAAQDDTGFAEQGGVIRIYVDNATTPVVSMSLGDFFMHSNHSDVFATPRVGRTARTGGTSGAAGSGAYRHLHMPFQKYLRVEIENLLSTEGAFYAKAEYSTTTKFADFGPQQLAYRIVGVRNSAVPKQTPVTVCDLDGTGQLESLLVTFHGASSGDNGILEGNVQIFVDGELYPSWSSSGMEDAFDGGWYIIPVGGYPSGRAGDSDLGGANVTMYRFFVTSPVYFSSHVKVVVNVGQAGQGTVTSATVQFASYVGLWLNTPTTPNYTVPDLVATPTRDEQMNDAAGVPPTARWLQQGDRTQWAATGTTYKILPGNASADQDARLAMTSLTPPTNFWLEGRVRINTAQSYLQEAYILALGNSPDPYYGSAIHVGINRVSVSQWVVVAKDSFDQVFLNQIGAGVDLLNVWVRIAIKKIGTLVTAYYSLNPSPGAWIPMGTWTPAQTGTAVGIATWTGGAEFDYLTIRPLKTVTS